MWLFIELSKNKLERARVSSNEGGYVSKGRSGSNCWISHDLSEKTKEIGQKIANKVNHPLENAERFQIIHYDKTQEYRRHYDSWDHDYSEKSLRCVKYGGFRLLTALCYLNDVEEGGELEFLYQSKRIKPRQGDFVLWPAGYTHHHRGNPPLKGEKYIYTGWLDIL